jgi:formyl-CoA transferase
MRLAETLDRHGVVCGPIYTIADIAADPHFKARDMILRKSDPRFDELAVPGVAPKLSVTPGDVGWLGADKPGKDNEEIYGELLGLGNGEIVALEEDGVI